MTYNNLIKNIMKKKKLTLEKFTIAKLNNPSKIFGGNEATDGGETGKGDKCIQLSMVIVSDKDNN
ncbi:hypothetical protein [Tenacibaculum sp.]|uniref:hypothetical protein n=1 Tax=Tenacibaculum sp. TaxID=1906242 RepID=UPI003AA8E60B